MKCPKCNAVEKTKADLTKENNDINAKVADATIYKEEVVVMLQKSKKKQ